jgi:hypothetical protein
MKHQQLIPVVSAAALLIATVAFAGHGSAGHGSAGHGAAPALVFRAAPHSMVGRIVAVRRVSQVITLQTADGQTHEIKVPSTALIATHSGSHFNSVRSGQQVHLTAESSAGSGLVARSLSVE